MGVAFCASLLRNLLSVGSLMAFPGSMVGALCCGLVYMLLKHKKPAVAITATLVAEMLGTGVLGGLCAYPVATLFMSVDAATTAVTAYHHPLLHLHLCRLADRRRARFRPAGGRRAQADAAHARPERQ